MMTRAALMRQGQYPVTGFRSSVSRNSVSNGLLKPQKPKPKPNTQISSKIDSNLKSGPKPKINMKPKSYEEPVPTPNPKAKSKVNPKSGPSVSRNDSKDNKTKTKNFTSTSSNPYSVTKSTSKINLLVSPAESPLLSRNQNTKARSNLSSRPSTIRSSFPSKPLSSSTSTPLNTKVAEDVATLKEENSKLREEVKRLQSDLEHTKSLCDNLLASTIGVRDSALSTETAPAPVLVPDSEATVNMPLPTIVPEIPELICLDSSDNVIADSADTDVNADVKRRVLIVGDSMTRHFGSILQNLLPEFSVSCRTFPGGRFEHAVQGLEELIKDKCS
uniref:Uncharacterized protein n=1 Tax=Cacopsylla melanoneura TaxID=428564 RepID=A0A8D9E6D6_9HEMI